MHLIVARADARNKRVIGWGSVINRHDAKDAEKGKECRQDDGIDGIIFMLSSI
jgi:hypothetical protein